MLSLCSSLKYELSESTSAMQKYQTNIYIEAEPRRLKLYVMSPDHVYDETSLIGRIRILFAKFWKFISSKPYCGEVADAVDAIIHRLFDKVITGAYEARQRRLVHQIQRMESHFKLNKNDELREGIKVRYFKHLENEMKGANVSLDALTVNFDAQLNGKTISDRDLIGIRNLITQVSSAVFSFWYKMLHSNEFRAGIRSFLPEKFPRATLEKPISGAVKELSIYNALLKEQNLINLEGLIEQPIPFIELVTTCLSDRELDVREKKRLDKWIVALNRYMSDDIENYEKMHQVVDLVKNALDEVVNVVEIQGGLNVSLGLLINKLDDRGCKLMRVEDPRHRIWRRDLKKGEMLKCEGVTYQLGDEIPTKKKEDCEKYKLSRIGDIDRYRIFKVENHSNLVVKVGKNPFDLTIDGSKFKDYHFGIPGPEGVQKIVKTDDAHPVVLLEFMPKPLAEHEWTSSEFRLALEDEMIASRLTSFLFCMYDWQLWPNELAYDHLYLNASGELRVTDWLDCGRRPEMPENEYCGPDNYLAAEKFCLSAAGTNQKVNPYLLRYFMEVSGYSKHTMALFFRECVTTMLKTGDFDFLESSLPYGYNNKVYKNKVDELFLNVKEIRQKCLNAVLDFTESKEDLLKKQKIDLDTKGKELELERENLKNDPTLLNVFKRKIREFKREKEALKDQGQELKEGLLKQTVQDIENWHHFGEQKPSFVKKILQVTKDLIDLQNQIIETEEDLNYLHNRKSQKNEKDIKIEKVKLSNLLSMERNLLHDEEILNRKILEITVFDRLLDAYLDSPTPASLGDSLIDTVLASFENPEKPKKQIDRENYRIQQDLYYKAQQELLIAKNRYAVEIGLGGA